MIGRVRGVLVDKSPGTVTVEAGGVGYELAVSERTLAEVVRAGGEVTLHVHTHVREDDITLYGFDRGADRTAFRTLLGVSGIGPRTALAALSVLDAETLWQLIAERNVDRLRTIPGIGRKTAERVVLELHDKLGDLGPAIAPQRRPGRTELVSALVNLGYRPAEAERAAAEIGTPDDGAPIPDLVRRALRLLER